MPPQIQKIIHIDMDCFFAAVEMRDRPDLAQRPLAVGGRPDSRGVISACNYVARKFKVHSALSSREAVRRCPDLIILPSRFSLYRAESRKIREIFCSYTQLIEPLSLDEAYLDVTELGGSATKVAQQIRKDIFDKTQLTASAGIANSKFLAKVASDWHKPNGQFTIAPHEVDNFIKTLPLKKIPGVGKATQTKLKKMNFETCGDLQTLNLQEMSYSFGSFGERLFDLCRGVDHSKVRPHRERKSISVESTFHKDLTEWNDIEKQVTQLFEELKRRMAKASISEDQLKSMAVKFKFNDFKSLSKETSPGVSNKEAFMQLAYNHFLDNNKPIRLIGIGHKLKAKKKKKTRHQLNLF